MLRFRLKTLLVITGVIALYLSAAKTHYQAARQAWKIKNQTNAILDDMYVPFRRKQVADFEAQAAKNPTYAAYKDDDPDVEIFVVLAPPYSDAGNKAGYAIGGAINGPTKINREIVLCMTDPNTDFSVLPISRSETKVHLTIEHYIPWYFFAGTPRTTITDHGAPDNEEFLKLLTTKLDEAGLHYQLQQQPRSTTN